MCMCTALEMWHWSIRRPVLCQNETCSEMGVRQERHGMAYMISRSVRFCLLRAIGGVHAGSYEHNKDGSSVSEHDCAWRNSSQTA